MKKMISTLIAIALIAGAAAFAEQDEARSIPGTNMIGTELETTIDVDGDGTGDSVFRVDDSGTVRLTVTVGGVSDTFEADLWAPRVCYADLDGNGSMEILITGDEESSDYRTYCLKWVEGSIACVPFSHIERGMEPHKGCYTKGGYGELLNVTEDGVLTLACTHEALGSWQGYRELKMNGFAIETCDDGVWKRTPADLEENSWGSEYPGTVTAITDVDCKFSTGDGEWTDGTIKAGEQLLVTGTDKDWAIFFVTEDGRSGKLRICYDPDVFGYRINYCEESELFEGMRYYD